MRIHRKTTKKDLHDPDNHDGVITHLEPDILECEVNWALESITMNKASGSDGITVELFQDLKDDVKAVYCHCAYLTYMQRTSCEMLGWMKYKLEFSRLPGETSITSDMQMMPPLWQKTKIMASVPIISWKIDGGNNGNSDRFYFFGLQNHCR